MEETLREVESASFKRKHVQSVFDILAETIDEASEKRDQELVKDPQLRKALRIVEDFLKKTGRVCYGGMAINAHLPPQLKFYDFTKSLPDYDFFTPEPEKDIEDLMRHFRSEGFTEAVAKMGIHKGTTKIFVNFNAVADITFTPMWMYTMLKKKAIKDDGIYFADADFLRMNMYLELSRPRGEVERWDKVYKRLFLLNKVKRPNEKSCKQSKKAPLTKLPGAVHNLFLEYCIENELVFAGAELKKMYNAESSTHAGYVLKGTSPVILFAENPELHMRILKQAVKYRFPELRLGGVHWSSKGDMFPEMFGLQINGKLGLLIVQEHFCHSYNTVSVPKKRELRITSLDSAITLYYSLSYLRGLEGLVPKSFQCFADALVDLSIQLRDEGKASKFPLFVVSCHGHQPTKPSLLREKVKRIEKMKKTKKLSSKHLYVSPYKTRKSRRGN
jgi:hypothetical protein